jgi:predicted dehydrogenase
VTETRFAVIGTGTMAATMMSTFALAGFPVTAVASRDLNRAKHFARLFKIPFASAHLEEILNSENVDAVYIANAPRDHAKTAIAALEAGKAVLCEKPMALSFADVQQVVNVARNTKSLLMEGLWSLFLPSHQLFFELSRTRHCGEPKALTADFGYPVSQDTLPRMLSPDRGGVLLDRGIYLIALALKVFGSVERVAAELVSTGSGPPEEAFLQLSHTGNRHSSLAASFIGYMSNTATLSCSNGLIRLESPLIGSETVSTRLVAAKKADEKVAQPSSYRRDFLSRLRQSSGLRAVKQALDRPTSRHAGYGRNRYAPQLKHFAAILKAGAQESDVVPLNFSLDVHRIIDLARADHQRRSIEREPKA